MAFVHEPAEFYMVWTRKGHVPRFTHETREGADTEAARLAEQNPGKKFIVLQAVQKVSYDLEPGEEMSAQAFGV